MKENALNAVFDSIDLQKETKSIMATTSTNSHGGKHRSDPEIEKYRLELNWTKIRDKLKSTKATGKPNPSFPF